MVLVGFVCFVYWFVVCILRFAFVNLWWVMFIVVFCNCLIC